MNWRRLVDGWLLVAIVVFVIFGAYCLWFPFFIDYGEGPLCDQARRLLAGEPLYRADWSQPPFTVDNYPPVYPVLVAALARASHLSLLRAGRLVSLVASASAAAMLARLARRGYGERGAGRLAAALFLSHAYVLEWAIAARVDALALALSLVALVIVEARPRSTAAAVTAAACAVLAAFTRQTYALAVPITCIYWLWYQRRTSALVFAASALSMALASFVWLDHLTDGGFFLHVVRANWNEYRVARVGEAAARFAMISAPAFALVAIAWRARWSTAWRRATWVYAMTAVVGALTVGKVGSWTNYLLEVAAALALLAAAAGPELARHVRPALSWLVVVQATWSFAMAGMLWREKLAVGFHSRDDYAALAELVRAADGPVLADDAMVTIVQTGRAIAFQPFERRQLQREGLWNGAPVVDGLTRRRYRLVILGAPGTPLCAERWGPEILDAVSHHYRPVLHAGNLVAYEPVVLKTRK
jgi:hypothetical protein